MEQTDHLLGEAIRQEQEIQAGKVKGPTKSLSWSSCPHPDGSMLGPSGRKSLPSLSHSYLRSPLAPLLVPVVLLPDGA